MAQRARVPTVKALTEKRKALLAERVAEHGEGAVQDAIEAVGRSDFCRGKNARSWRADFTFMLQPENFVRLIEGSFDDVSFEGQPKEPPSEPETRVELERAIEMNQQYDNPKTVARFQRKLAALLEATDPA